LCIQIARQLRNAGISDYVRYEYEATPVANLAAGERVRWLPRRWASDLALPGNDFWLLDDQIVFNHFTGDGEWTAIETATDPAVARWWFSRGDQVG
jgi:hypothetical protein